VIGTAISGDLTNASSVLRTPVVDYILQRSALGRRTGAGPALGFSLILVAIVCSLSGLCYAELASMIPIAGSAYTYAYAILGELIAWIIGWDLILEYAFSNMSVSMGFVAHVVDLMDWCGIRLNPRWISPAYLPHGLQDLQSRDIYLPSWHYGFNIPAFIIVLLLTVLLVRGIRESIEVNNVMVLMKIGAILVFLFFGMSFIHPAYYHPFAPNGFPGVLTGGSIIFFTYIGFDSVSTASEEYERPQRDMPIVIIATPGDLYVALCGGSGCAYRDRPVGLNDRTRRTCRERTEEALSHAGRPSPALDSASNSARGADRHGLCDPCVSARPVSHMVCNVARPVAAGLLQQSASAVSHTRCGHLGGRLVGGDPIRAF
jgi:amino acid permease-like protein